jgi:hypothetical protein
MVGYLHERRIQQQGVLDPGRDPPPIGTFKQILKQAGIPEEIFR